MSVSEKRIKELQAKYETYQRAPKYDLNSQPLYCVCRREDDGELMVACDGCDEWYHFRCMKLNQKYKDLVSNYYCIFCHELFDRGETLWKRKCRIPTCYQPIEISGGKPSKYCSKEHGIEFMNTIVLKQFSANKKTTKISPEGRQAFTEKLDPEQVSYIVSHVNTVKDLKQLGDILPDYSKFMQYSQGITVELPKETIDSLAYCDKSLEVLQRIKAVYASKNEYLTIMIDQERNRISNELLSELNEDSQQSTAKTNKKGKGKNKAKNKVDICLYDSRLGYSENEWREFMKSKEYKQRCGQDGYPPISKEVMKQDYHLMKKELFGDDESEEEEEEEEEETNKEDVPMDEDVEPEETASDHENYFTHICLVERKKCNKHSRWYALISDNLHLKLNELDFEINELTTKKAKIIKDCNLRNWENYESEN
ncbi:unnamed protein product [[Candida] boidinii]|uniref:Unnamed protein product n=1 Tax=Candida boidinii TaxID=5477 RepID=A0ACB5TGJ0_CANBO|nr:unnamed protein product [[Candida] boidinii]